MNESEPYVAGFLHAEHHGLWAPLAIYLCPSGLASQSQRSSPTRAPSHLLIEVIEMQVATSKDGTVILHGTGDKKTTEERAQKGCTLSGSFSMSQQMGKGSSLLGFGAVSLRHGGDANMSITDQKAHALCKVSNHASSSGRDEAASRDGAGKRRTWRHCDGDGELALQHWEWEAAGREACSRAPASHSRLSFLKSLPLVHIFYS
ncbi:unnamed protein product [Urochloa humidicola]